MKVREYISNSWDKSLRQKGHRPDGIALPYPYNSPCAEGLFDEFYYWDTCFINKGLITDGKYEYAMQNLLNMAYLIQRYGYMPNAAVEGMLNRSQPPLFGMMCYDLYHATQDERLKQKVLPALKTEYEYWMKNRILPCGLNAYGNSATKEVKVYMATEFEQRLGKKFEADREELGSNVLAECESGWDFSPRFNHRCTEYAPIDLNCIMYINEMVIATFESDLIEKQKYENFALLRKQKMLKYMFNGEFLNDAIPEKTVSNTVSVATLFPFLVGIQSDKITLKKLLDRLECKNGIPACEKQNYNNTIYQWGYPNMWAPLVYFAFFALKQSGLIVDANRIGEKYLTAVEKTFEKTLKLWEKYDAETGEKATVNEYTETQMLGWTAGVYNLLFDLIRRKNEN
jgi:alpha,alpha-trehalase